MECTICAERPAIAGVLCDDCRDDLSRPPHLIPEQIQSAALHHTSAALIDVWGRPHRLDARAVIGRTLAGTGVAVIDGGVSRHHAHVAIDDARQLWQLRDLGSVNGTFLNDVMVTEPVVLRDRDRVRVGQVAFYFLRDAEGLPPVQLDPAASSTIRSPAPAPPAAAAAPAVNEFEHAEATDPGIPIVPIEVQEPTGGGGGLVIVHDRQVQLAEGPFALFQILLQRMRDDAASPQLVRGFVRSSELLGQLPWDSHDPEDNNVKQLVRRLRRALIRASIGDLIESRQRFGYRLRVAPAPGAAQLH
jgi:hypothetical protein